MVDNRSIFTVLRRGLRHRGLRPHRDDQLLDLHRRHPHRGRRPRRRGRADRRGDRLRAHPRHRPLDGRAHRPLLRDPPRRRPHVHTLVTLGTPHQGSYLAYAWHDGLTQQLRPGSRLMGSSPARQGVPDPVHLLLVRPRPGCRSRAQRRAAPCRLERSQHRAARGRAHEPSDQLDRGERDLDRLGPPRRDGRDCHPRCQRIGGRRRPQAGRAEHAVHRRRPRDAAPDRDA